MPCRLAAIPIATVIDVGVAARTESLIAAYSDALHLLIESESQWHDIYAQTYGGINYVPRVMLANTVNRIDALPFDGPALLKIDVVPLTHVTAKKLNGTIPQRTKTWKSGMLERKILVKTKKRTAIITRGLSRDQKTPSDMLR